MRLPNRSLQVCIVEKDSLSKYAAELARAGLYVLIDDPFEISRAYVGETENLSNRLTQHFRDPQKKIFHAAVIVYDDGTLLDKLGAKYLEHRVVAILSQHGLTSNIVKPTAPRVATHIADALEELLSDLKLVCFSVNLNLFERRRVERDRTRVATHKIGDTKQRERVVKTGKKSSPGWSALVAWLEHRPEQRDMASIIAAFIAQGGPTGRAPEQLHLEAHKVLKTAIGLGFKFEN